MPLERLRGMEIDASAGNEDAPEWVDLAVSLLEAFGAQRPGVPAGSPGSACAPASVAGDEIRSTRRRPPRNDRPVTARISHTSFDAVDAYAQSVFWAGVLGFGPDPDQPDEPGDEECMIFSPDGRTRILFIEVPETKQVKNRVHLDLMPESGSRDEELARLLGLGATVVDDLRRPDGTGWVVLADPEGNEFCILRSDAERAAG